MPYKSKAQQRYFHEKLPQYAHEWDEATKKAGGFKKLPQHVKKPKRKSAAKSNKSNKPKSAKKVRR